MIGTGKQIVCTVILDGHPIRALIDSGAAYSVISSKFVKRSDISLVNCSKEYRLVGANGTPLSLLGACSVIAEIGLLRFQISLIVCEDIYGDLLILGNDVLGAFNLKMDYEIQRFELDGSGPVAFEFEGPNVISALTSLHTSLSMEKEKYGHVKERESHRQESDQRKVDNTCSHGAVELDATSSLSTEPVKNMIECKENTQKERERENISANRDVVGRSNFALREREREQISANRDVVGRRETKMIIDKIRQSAISDNKVLNEIDLTGHEYDNLGDDTLIKCSSANDSDDDDNVNTFPFMDCDDKELRDENEPMENTNMCILQADACVPGNSSMCVEVSTEKLSEKDTYWFTPDLKIEIAYGLYVSSGFVNPKRIIVFIINLNHDTVSLREGQVLGQIEKKESVMVRETECYAISQEKFDPTIFDINPEISPADRQELVSLLHDYWDVFATSTKNLGSTNKVKHSINTQEANPIRQRLWTRYSSAENDFISQQIAEILEAGVISRTISPWAINVVLAKKKDGTLRFCTDFRQLNDVTVFDSYSLPRNR